MCDEWRTEISGTAKKKEKLNRRISEYNGKVRKKIYDTKSRQNVYI